MKQRENNYDLLRSICAVMVVVLHAGAFYEQSNIIQYAMLGVLAQAITRTAVPCFIMLSGAFLLGDERWKDYKFAIKKTRKVILAPTVGYSIIFIGLSCLTYYVGISDASYKEVIVLALKGYPYPHMWYMFICLGLYFVTPLLWYFKERMNKLGQGKYLVLIVFFIIVGSMIQAIYSLIWVVRFVTFIGYFMLGDWIRMRYTRKDGVTWSALILWLCAISISCYIQIRIPEFRIWGGLHTDPLNPIVIIASIACFVFFASLDVKWNTFPFAKHTSRIYLIHIVPLQFIKVVMERVARGLIHPIVGIPVMTLCALGCSIIYSIVVKQIKGKIKMEWL